jgi:cation transport ATPase
MTSKYSIDDILDEVRRKRETASPTDGGLKQSRGQEPKSRKSVPFRLAGLEGDTGDFERQNEANPSPISSPDVKTPALKPEDTPGGDFVAAADSRHYEFEDTRFVGDESPASNIYAQGNRASFEQRRRERVRQFMEGSFSLPDDEPPGGHTAEIPPSALTEADVSQNTASLHDFFGGLHAQPSAGVKTAGLDALHLTDETGFSGPHDIPEPVEGEYARASDASAVRRDIKRTGAAVLRRVIISGTCFAALFYLALCNLYPLPLYNPVCPENNMTAFLLTNLAVMLIAVMVSYSVIGSGLISLFTFRADFDTPFAVCVLVSIIHSVAVIVKGDFLFTGQGHFFLAAAAFGLFGNALGKYMAVLRVRRNFSVTSSQAAKTGEFIIADPALASLIGEGLGFDEPPAVSYAAETGFPEDFLRISYSQDASESLGRIASMLFLIFSGFLAIASMLFFKQNAMQGLTIFCAGAIITSPFTATIASNFPLLRASRALAGQGAMLAGHESLEVLGDIDAVLLDAVDLYPSPNAVLHGIKALSQSRIDEAIIDAASIMNSAQGLLRDIFLGIIGGRLSILKPVERLKYEGNLGLSAVVDGKPVIIGSRRLMIDNLIDVPAHDFESRYTKGGRQILYLANSGEITAMFVVSYNPDTKAMPLMRELARRGVGFIIRSSDPNITAFKIANDYSLDEARVSLVPDEAVAASLRLTAAKERGPAHLLSISGSGARLRALASVHRVLSSNRAATALQLLGLVCGYALTAYLAFTGSILKMGFNHLIAFQAFWAALIILIPNLKKI